MRTVSTKNPKSLVALALVMVHSIIVQPVSAQESKLISPDNDVLSPSVSNTYSLSACFSKADENNREIAAAKWNMPIAKAGIKLAGALPNPQLFLQAGFGDSFQYVFDGQTQQFGIIQQILTGGKRTKKIELAKANYELTSLQLDALRFSVHNRVRRAYAELAAAEAFEALVESQRTVGLRLVDVAQKRFEAGKAAKSEYLQANLNVMQFDTQRNQAQGRLQQASAALTMITGEKPSRIEVLDVDDNGIFKLSVEHTDIVPSPVEALPDLTSLLATAYASRPDLKVAEQQIYANRKALVLAKSKKIPDFFLGVGGTYSTFTQNQPAGLASTGNWVGTGIFTSVTAETPVFYQYQGEVLQADGTLRQSQKTYELTRAQVGTDVVNDYTEVQVARANIFAFQKNILPKAKQVADLARRGYELGATPLATAILAQQQYQQILGNYFDAVVTYQNAWADLENAVGLPLK